ncbi:MAG: hypothetical protein QW290_02690 [Sulfolobales archaeon]
MSEQTVDPWIVEELNNYFRIVIHQYDEIHVASAIPTENGRVYY